MCGRNDPRRPALRGMPPKSAQFDPSSSKYLTCVISVAILSDGPNGFGAAYARLHARRSLSARFDIFGIREDLLI